MAQLKFCANVEQLTSKKILKNKDMNNILTSINKQKLQFNEQLKFCVNPIQSDNLKPFIEFLFRKNNQLQISKKGAGFDVYTKDKIYRFVEYQNHIVRIDENVKKIYYLKS